MSALINNEIRALGNYIRRNKNDILVIVLAALFLILSRYHRFETRWLNFLLYYALFPFLSVILILRKNPVDFGLKPGDFRIWWLHVVIACGISIGLAYIGLRIPGVKEFYSGSELEILDYILQRIVIIFSIEFIFRGFILFGLKETFGESAILVQMIPFAILHIGKPEIEAVGCLITGIYFGYVAYRTRSIWPSFLIHLFVNVLNKYLHLL
jgi:membrane protease YdiL (CAAX protease family)